MQRLTRLLMDPGAHGEVPPWGNFHFLFQGNVTTAQVTNTVYWECYLSGLAAILYHVQPDYQSSFNIRTTISSYTLKNHHRPRAAKFYGNAQGAKGFREHIKALTRHC